MDIRAQTFSTPDLLPFARAQDQALQISSNEPRGDSTSDIRQPSLQEQPLRKLATGLDGLNTRLQEVGRELKNIEHLCLSAACSPADYPADTQGVADYLKARQLQGATLQGALHGLDSALEMRLPQEHLLDAQLNMYANYSATAGSAEQKLFAADTLEQLPTMESAAGNIQYAPPKKPGGDFFKELNGMIGFIRTDYLNIYENTLTRYSSFYKEFNEEVMSKMGGWITGLDDGKKVRVDKELYKALTALSKKYWVGANTKSQGILFPPPNEKGEAWGVENKAEAEKWAVAMGLDVKCVLRENYRNGRVGYVVKMDISPLELMSSSLPGFNQDDNEFDTAKFQAWQTGFNSQEAEMKNQLQMFTTKYGNANSYHENFNKILSSQLSQYAEMLKTIVGGI